MTHLLSLRAADAVEKKERKRKRKSAMSEPEARSFLRTWHTAERLKTQNLQGVFSQCSGSMSENSTASRLNRAKSQYESILMGLHLPADPDTDCTLPHSRIFRSSHPAVSLQSSEGVPDDDEIEEILVSQQVLLVLTDCSFF
jgi:hypothetical protein